MTTRILRFMGGTALAGVAFAGPALAIGEGATQLPPPQVLDQRAPVELLPYEAIQSFHRLETMNQPDWMDAMVEAGALPPLEERVPSEPLVFNTDIMPDGAGAYGGVFRHVIGGRPQGWNWTAGLHQGWGGINYTVQECLTRTGPMYLLDDSRVEPLPNLAKSWEWSEDGMSLTMNLVEGARWSDGDPFDADDLMFHWDMNVMDPNVPSVMSPGMLGEGTTLERVDDFTVKFTFPVERPILNLYSMAYRNFCPGPSHILEPLHPANSGSTYDDYINALARRRVGGDAAQSVLLEVRQRGQSTPLYRRNALRAEHMGRPHGSGAGRIGRLLQHGNAVDLS